MKTNSKRSNKTQKQDKIKKNKNKKNIKIRKKSTTLKEKHRIKNHNEKEIKVFKNILIITGILIICIIIIFHNKITFDAIQYSDGISFKYFYNKNDQVFAKIIISANISKICKVIAKYNNKTLTKYFNVTKGLKDYDFEIPDMPTGHTKVLFILNCSKNMKNKNGI